MEVAGAAFFHGNELLLSNAVKCRCWLAAFCSQLHPAPSCILFPVVGLQYWPQSAASAAPCGQVPGAAIAACCSWYGHVQEVRTCSGGTCMAVYRACQLSLLRADLAKACITVQVVAHGRPVCSRCVAHARLQASEHMGCCVLATWVGVGPRGSKQTHVVLRHWQARGLVGAPWSHRIGITSAMWAAMCGHARSVATTWAGHVRHHVQAGGFKLPRGRAVWAANVQANRCWHHVHRPRGLSNAVRRVATLRGQATGAGLLQAQVAERSGQITWAATLPTWIATMPAWAAAAVLRLALCSCMVGCRCVASAQRSSLS